MMVRHGFTPSLALCTINTISHYVLGFVLREQSTPPARHTSLDPLIALLPEGADAPLVTSAFWTLHSALGPLGAAIMTAAVAAYGVDATLLLTGAALLIVAVAAAFTPIRLPRPEQIGGETA